jgi:hypothetical protein
MTEVFSLSLIIINRLFSGDSTRLLSNNSKETSEHWELLRYWVVLLQMRVVEEKINLSKERAKKEALQRTSKRECLDTKKIEL